jgi:mannan endo-1,6-alpha-mannosidase
MKWTDNGTWDGTSGVGQQMSALEVVQSNLIQQVSSPLTNTTGGTSQGNPNAGTGSSTSVMTDTIVITTGDRVGAGFITIGVTLAVIGGAWWVIT